MKNCMRLWRQDLETKALTDSREEQYRSRLAAKCESLRPAIASLRDAITSLKNQREKAHQDWHAATRERQDDATGERLAGLISEQHRLVRLMERYDSERRRAEERLKELQNDWNMSGCERI